MKMMMFFPLLLLICSLSTAQLQKQTESRGREPANVSEHQQIYPQDIHAVLREMSALLAELKVEVKHLQRQSEGQAAKMNQLEQQQQAKVKEQEMQKTEVDKLKQQYQAQAGELISIKSRTNITENQVEALNRDREVKQVAFSASLFDSGKGIIGTGNTFRTLVFKHIITNIGNAYNPQTGIFTAPVRGAYHFELSIHMEGSYGKHQGAVLVKNEQHIIVAWESQPTHYGSVANGATVLLEIGDIVYLSLWLKTRIYFDEPHPNTFSGHLLFTM